MFYNEVIGMTLLNLFHAHAFKFCSAYSTFNTKDLQTSLLQEEDTRDQSAFPADHISLRWECLRGRQVGTGGGAHSQWSSPEASV